MTGLNEISDIPKSWRSALASIQRLFPDAVIAGGALRDREHGIKVKDIDIFVSTTTDGTYGAGTIVSRLQRDGWRDVALNGDESYANGAAHRGVVAVVDTVFPGCPPIQLIAMKNFKLEEIDFGICQIQFDGKTIYRTRDYHFDKDARQFRVIPKMPDAEFVRTLGRWARLKEKYPEWTLHLGSRADDAPFVAPVRVTEQVFHHYGVTTATEALQRAMNNLGVPLTGRLASKHPNMQQLSRTTDGIHPPFAYPYYRPSFDILDASKLIGPV